MPSHARPLSPHLSIFRWTITMAMSIAHRATGIALYAGMVLLAAWFVGAALGQGALEAVHWAFGTWLGQLVLFGFTWTLIHHLIGGLRHFIWDLGYGFTREQRFGLAWANLIASIVLTLLAWAVFVWF